MVITFVVLKMTWPMVTTVRLMYNVLQTYKEAVTSVNAEKWVNAMDEEIQSLEENATFTLTTLPEGKDVVGGKWVYAMKKNSDGTDKYKARYVAKGYSQKRGVNYDETFSPTASMTSIKVLAMKAAQNDLIVHQMDVKTAYLHAPIEHEIYIEQPEGYEVKSKGNGKLVCKLKKSLYGLKQSRHNWNKMLHDMTICVRCSLCKTQLIIVSITKLLTKKKYT